MGSHDCGGELKETNDTDMATKQTTLNFFQIVPKDTASHTTTSV